MHQTTVAIFQKRSRALLLVLVFLFSLLVGQFFRLQVLQTEHWKSAARKQHTLTIVEPAQRGRFLANADLRSDTPSAEKVLVADVPKYHLHVDPLSLPRSSYSAIADQIVKLLASNKEQASHFRQKILLQLHKRSRDRTLATWIEPSERSAIETWWLNYHLIMRIPRNGLFFTSDYQRNYPMGPMLGPILQTVRRERSRDQSAIPIGGLELTLQSHLIGISGKRQLLRSLKNPMETGTVTTPAISGKDIYLTVDHILQSIAEEELEKGIAMSGAQGGWALLIDCHSGAISALAHAPHYNPEKYWEYFNEKKIDWTRPRAICEAHELGSVFKPLHCAIALKANELLQQRGSDPLFDTEEKIDTRPSPFPGRKEMKDVTVRRHCNLDLALQKSSNVYMARLVHRIGNQLGFQWYRDQLLNLGFVDKTGIGIPGEARASIPPFNGPNAGRWSSSTPSSLCLGHSLQLNALHLARAYCALANGGYLITPHLIKSIGKPPLDGGDFKRNPIEKKRVFSKAICQRVLKGMSFVTQPGGTGFRAAVPGFGICGKTGTAEKVINGTYSKNKMLSTFVGIMPEKAPRFVLLVTVDEPSYGYREGVGLNHRAGVCAAPIFGQIAKRSLEYLCFEKEYPEKEDFKDGEEKKIISEQTALNEKERNDRLIKLREFDLRWNSR